MGILFEVDKMAICQLCVLILLLGPGANLCHLFSIKFPLKLFTYRAISLNPAMISNVKSAYLLLLNQNAHLGDFPPKKNDIQ